MATRSNQKNNQNSSSKRKRSAREREAKRKTKLVIFGVEIVVILAMLAVLYVVMTKVNDEGPKLTYLAPENLAIPEEVKKESEEGSMKGYVNIALFGVDARTENTLYKSSRSDSTMIASINMDTGEIRLVSVYRDTYLNLGNDTYQKCNAAYANGGAEQAIKMLNMNLDMDIKDFVAVGYLGVIDVVDGLGGVYIDVDDAELKHLNNYQKSMTDPNLKDAYVPALKNYPYVPVTQTGYQKLNGLQAAAYCRIRYTAGDDFMRTARQREVLKAIEDQAKNADYATLLKVFNSVIDDVYTSIDEKDLMTFLENISKYKIVEEGGFPEESMRTTGDISSKGSCVVPLDLESNVVWLHQFLFDDEDYHVTAGVREISEKVRSDTAPYIRNKSN